MQLGEGFGERAVGDLRGWASQGGYAGFEGEELLEAVLGLFLGGVEARTEIVQGIVVVGKCALEGAVGD
jgi:hypothetical protein